MDKFSSSETNLVSMCHKVSVDLSQVEVGCTHGLLAQGALGHVRLSMTPKRIRSLENKWMAVNLSLLHLHVWLLSINTTVTKYVH